MGEKPIRISWNPDFETFEAVYPDGYILPLRDSFEAEQLAREHEMLINIPVGGVKCADKVWWSDF